MTNLVVHAGIHKTGSTSLQIFLKANQAQLEKLNIYRIHPLEDGGPSKDTEPTCHGLARAFIQRDLKKIKEYEKRVVRFLKKAIPKKTDTFILSSEEFDRFTADTAKLFKEHISSHFDSFKVSIYIRPHAALINSQHSQQLREGFIKQRISPFFRSCVKHAWFVKLDEIIGGWVEVFGKESVLVNSAVREDLFKKDISHDFFKLIIGIELPDGFLRSPNANTKLTLVGREALVRLLHDPRLSDLDFSKRRVIFNTYFRSAPKTHILLENKPMPIDYSLLEASKGLFKKDYEAVNKKYFNGKLDYELWYKKQINLFDRFRREMADKDHLDVNQIQLAQEEFWAFTNKSKSRKFVG